MGKDKFTFEIICNYKTRGGVVSGEVHFQTDSDVLSPELLPCGERLYYNGQIGHVKFVTPEFHSAETRAKLSADKMGEKNPNYGKPRSAEVRAKISASFSAETRAKLSANKMGEKHHQYGKPRSAEVRAKMSASLSKGPYLISFKGGHTEEWQVLTNQDGYDDSGLYRVLSGKQKKYKDIVKVERIGSDDR